MAFGCLPLCGTKFSGTPAYEVEVDVAVPEGIAPNVGAAGLTGGVGGGVTLDIIHLLPVVTNDHTTLQNRGTVLLVSLRTDAGTHANRQCSCFDQL